MKRLDILCGGAAMGLIMSLASCTGDAPFIGKWKESAPSDITRLMPGTSSATDLVTITFAGGQYKDRGTVEFSSDFDIAGIVASDSVPRVSNFKATATVNGDWTYDVDDKDDILITFDMSSFKVSCDCPEDNNESQVWEQRISQAVRSSLSRYTVIEDIEVSKDGRNMTFEVQNPDTKLHFSKQM